MSARLNNLAIASQAEVARPGEVRARAASSRRSKRVKPKPLDRRVQVVLIVLEENSHRRLAAAEIARMVNLSVGRLAHLFKAEMGMSPQQYLTEIRLAKAKQKLESGFLSIKEIAASVGFSSVNQFIDTFKTVYSLTPAQHRNLPRAITPQRKDLAIARSANE